MALPIKYVETLSYEWPLIAEGIYLEFDVMLIGLCSTADHTMIINPGKQEMQKHKYVSRFYDKYSIGILIADEQSQANSVAFGLSDSAVIDRIVHKLILAEEEFTIRRKATTSIYNGLKPGSSVHTATTLKEIVRVTKMWSDATQPGDDPETEDKNGSDNEDEKDEYIGYVTEEAKIKIKGAWMRSVQKSSLAEDKKSIFGLTKSMFNTVLNGSKKDIEEEEQQSQDGEGEYEDDGNDDDDESIDVAVDRRTSVINMRRRSNFNTPTTPANSSPNQSHSGKVLMKGGRATMLKNSSQSSLIQGRRSRSDSNNQDEEFEKQLRDMKRESMKTGMDRESQSLMDASEFKDHIVVFGCTTNLSVFIAELRRPLVSSSSYHSVVVVDDVEPSKWDFIVEAFNDVYFMKGKMTSSKDFNRTNIRDAFAVVLLAGRDTLSKVEEENLDADTLFAYLKLEKYIPRDVFFTVELTCASNMAVLNSTVIRRAAGSNANLIYKGSSRQHTISHNSSRTSVTSDSGSERDATTRSLMTAGSDRSRLKTSSQAPAVAPRQSRGTFTSSKKMSYTSTNMSKSLQTTLKLVPGRRISSLEHKESAKKDSKGTKTNKSKVDNFWTARDTHHLLPVFASGRAFVPSTFDSLLCQSFYSQFTPLLCEKLVCGSKYQTFFLIPLPVSFVGRYFVDLYRSFISRNIMIIAIYRAPFAADFSFLPFVYTSPKPDTLLRSRDRIFVYCNPLELKMVMELCLDLPFTVGQEGAVFLTDKRYLNAKYVNGVKTMPAQDVNVSSGGTGSSRTPIIASLRDKVSKIHPQTVINI